MNDDLVPNEHLNGISAEATGPQRATDELAESLRQLLSEAILMLAYSRRQGISIPDAEITTVVAFNDLFAKGQVPESETRVQFLQSYEHIAKLIRPATISSLQAVLGNDFVEIVPLPTKRFVDIQGSRSSRSLYSLQPRYFGSSGEDFRKIWPTPEQLSRQRV
jgi:hypothetical protein